MRGCAAALGALTFGPLLFFSGLSGASEKKEARSDFQSLCLEKSKNEVQAKACKELSTIFFSNAKPELGLFKPQQINVTAQPIDSKIQYLVFNDPNFVPGVAYCYFVYRTWINPKDISPDAFALRVSGFAILNESIEAYQKWLEHSPSGKKCKSRVEKESGVTVTNLQDSLKSYAAIIGINPYAALESSNFDLAKVKSELALTVVHERIHAYQVLCPSFEEWGRRSWSKLSKQEQREFAQKYPAYNWKDEKIAAREYVAFKFENEPEKLAPQIDACAI